MEKIRYFPWESLIDILLNYVDTGIHIVDKDGVTLFYNKANSKLEGLNEDEVIGKNILDIFPSLTYETSTLLKVLKTKEPILNKLQVFLTYKGKEVTTLNYTFPLFYRGELIGAIELSRDITEVKKLSEKIIELKSKNLEQKENKILKRNWDDFKTNDENLKKKIKEIENVKNLNTPILIIGESGVGKRLLAEIIHFTSDRKNKEFLYQDCDNFEESILEESIFSLIKISDGSTLYIANIDKMPLRLQDKLTYFLESNEFNFRLITSIENLPIFSINSGNLKKELFFLISKIEVMINPLRERKEDIVLLLNYYLEELEKKYNLNKSYDENFKEFLLSYIFPGNVRELFYIIEYSYLKSKNSKITINDLPNSIYFKEFDLSKETSEFEKKIIKETLYLTNFNISKAGKILKIPRQTLQYKIKKYGIEERRTKK
ncbi:MAG TPA: sigma 54-interacting transcriptional regulator [Caldisericia bacterium]|nr:sigma 54-interacting transcriptional regulator [Caldisericia bacterium]HPB34423.1 sigma 54-interacting transcriptional regulator [Caldisericia bacterium]HQL66251.1 sigma 54-interacting transcriptional regulator [Caldisericia bacterium]HQN48126.1 sigma 54-interacting transcriptional regulator [Caldisericia bacterium]HQP00086.1 sigma 54-interacting transcriptional regulator [Caldisericia bacterium]